MYPMPRLMWQLWQARKQPMLPIDGTHVSTHICWPIDLDFLMELNNGRTLTLYDLGRTPLGLRIGLLRALKEKKWGLTVAGSSTRYRRRVRMFDKLTMKSRGIGWDDRFLYVEQSMWNSRGDCTSHVLIRSAITDKDGIVCPDEFAKYCGHTGPRIDPPDWVLNWANADATRSWPPMQDT